MPSHVPIQIDSHISYSHQHKSAKNEASKKGGFSSALQELLTEDYSSVFDSSLLGNPWRAVEAYHFFLLVQKLFYSGNMVDSLVTVSGGGCHGELLYMHGVLQAISLRDYEDILPPLDLYSLLALVSSACKAFGLCSKVHLYCMSGLCSHACHTHVTCMSYVGLHQTGITARFV